MHGCTSGSAKRGSNQPALTWRSHMAAIRLLKIHMRNSVQALPYPIDGRSVPTLTEVTLCVRTRPASSPSNQFRE